MSWSRVELAASVIDEVRKKLLSFGKRNYFSTKVRKVEKDELDMMLTEMLGKDGEMLVAKPEVKEGKKEAALRLLLVEASRHALTSEVLYLLEDELGPFCIKPYSTHGDGASRNRKKRMEGFLKKI